ncbi:MAG TPA: Uma2 family endonuclease [Rhodopila sp.]|nr:Uma2 family endonuclease [Rhodopila sp.]
MDTAASGAEALERFLAWEDKQDGRHEFDGRDIIPMTGETFAHQQIVINLCSVLIRLLAEHPFRVTHGMRLRTAVSVRHPDALISAAPVDQATSTLVDAAALFEVLSPETDAADRVQKLQEYATVPSLRCYVLLEQKAPGALVFARHPGAPWVPRVYRSGDIPLPGLDLTLPLAELYRGLRFEEAGTARPGGD